MPEIIPFFPGSFYVKKRFEKKKSTSEMSQLKFSLQNVIDFRKNVKTITKCKKREFSLIIYDRGYSDENTENCQLIRMYVMKTFLVRKTGLLNS